MACRGRWPCWGGRLPQRGPQARQYPCALEKLADRVPDANVARHNDLGVGAAQPQLAADRRVDEPQGVVPESRRELLAAEVRLGGDLDDRGAQLDTRSRWQVGLAQVEVDVELIAGELPPVRLHGYQRSGSRVHQVELHVRMRGPVGSPAA